MVSNLWSKKLVMGAATQKRRQEDERYAGVDAPVKRQLRSPTALFFVFP